MRDGPGRIHRINQTAWTFLIVAVSAVLGMSVAWRAPGLDLYARDWLMRIRGPLAAPDDIVIVAIDEASIARFGRFPWPRSVMARAIDAIAASHPKVIALDVLYTDPATQTGDAALVDSIARAGNVVAAAQLVAESGAGAGHAGWLRPLPAIERAAAGVGHVNVSTESEGVARRLLLRQSDDRGQAFWAMAVEAIRVADQTPESAVSDSPGAVRVGERTIPVQPNTLAILISAEGTGPRLETLRADEMTIDYIGPAGSFARQTCSLADVVDGRCRPGRLSGKYVLVGATAAALGDRLASPFIHREGASGNQHGDLMPGVEVLANAVNTILRARFYSDIPDWGTALFAALVAAAALGALSITQERHEMIGQLGALGGLAGAILGIGYLVFTRFLIVPPLVPSLVSFAVAVPLALLRRSLTASAGLDVLIGELAQADAAAVLATNSRPNPAELIARLAQAAGVAIFARSGLATRRYRLVAVHGAPVIPTLARGDHPIIAKPVLPLPAPAEADSSGEPASRYFSLADAGPPNSAWRALKLTLGDAAQPSGALLIAHSAERRPAAETLRICVEIASGYLTAGAADGEPFPPQPSRWGLPRGIEWKANALGELSRLTMARARFVDRALRSVEDGLLVAGVDGRIAFANRRAEAIFGVPECALIGGDLIERISEGEHGRSAAPDGAAAIRILTRLLVERGPVERQIVIGEVRKKHYMLRLSAVTAGDQKSSAVLGIVASLSDITEQIQLQQTKNDVMALVSHEMRTPLTAIQGMSELLAQFEVEPERRRAMHLAINDEVKRLVRMISDYLDITRLESGVRTLRLAPVRLEALIERALLMLDPLAAQRRIQLVRQFAPDLPPLLADADLLARAVTNLVANAIKYSPPDTEVTITAGADSDSTWIEVADHGWGIAPDDLEHIFEKFYRVARIEDADVPGSGLGLALVREVAELHGGKVSATSELGSGSTFSLRFPVKRKEGL